MKELDEKKKTPFWPVAFILILCLAFFFAVIDLRDQLKELKNQPTATNTAK